MTLRGNREIISPGRRCGREVVVWERSASRGTSRAIVLKVSHSQKLEFAHLLVAFALFCRMFDRAGAASEHKSTSVASPEIG